MVASSRQSHRSEISGSTTGSGRHLGVIALAGFYLLGAVALTGAALAHSAHPASGVSGAPFAKNLPADNTTGGNGSAEGDQGGDNESSVCSGDGGDGVQGNDNSQGNDSQGDGDTGNATLSGGMVPLASPLDNGTLENETGDNATGENDTEDSGSVDNSTGDDGSGNTTGCAADPPVTFKALGLPSGSTWSVAAGSPALTVSNTTVGHKGLIVFNVTDGLLNYTITPPSGYGVAKIVGPGQPSMTSDLINGTTVLTVKFSVFEQLTFSEKGLPAGSVWAITLWSSLPHGGPAGQSASNTTGPSGGSITFTVLKGSWKYNLTEIPTNYTAHPHRGSVGVPGHDVTRHIRFHLLHTPSTPGLEPSSMSIALFLSRLSLG